jgi:hypothetical protein
MAKAIKSISHQAKVKADAALLADATFAADEAKFVEALAGFGMARNEIIRVLQLYATDLIRLAALRVRVVVWGMSIYVGNVNTAALVANPKLKPDELPLHKCDAAFIQKLATWNDGKFPEEFGKVRQAGYEKVRTVFNMAGVDPKVLNPQGAKSTTGKGKRGTRRNASVANAKTADAAGKAATAQVQTLTQTADDMRAKASVETVTDLAALKKAYDTDKARIVKLQAANAKLYTGAVLMAHQELIAAFDKFMKIKG